MKNAILGFLFIGAASSVFGQDSIKINNEAQKNGMQMNSTMSSNTSYPINNDLSNRTAAKDMNNAITPAALPVFNTFVSPEITSRTASSYGKNLYSITQVKTAMGENAYQVTLIDNGQSRSEWINESGTAIANVFRTAETDSMNALTKNMGNNNTWRNTGNTSATNTNTTTNQNTDVNAANTQVNTTTNNAMGNTTNTMNNTGLNGNNSNGTSQNNWNNNSNTNSNTGTVGKAGMNQQPNKQGMKKSMDKGTMNKPTENNGNKTMKSSPTKPKEQ